MFGKKSKEITRLTEELDASKQACLDITAQLGDAAKGLRAANGTIGDLKSEVKNLRSDVASRDAEITRLKDLLDIAEKGKNNESVLLSSTQNELQAARRGEDPETDAFYTAKLAAPKAKQKGEEIKHATASEEKTPAPTSTQKASRSHRRR